MTEAISLRERALAAWQAAKAERDEQEAERRQRDAAHMRASLIARVRDALGVEPAPEQVDDVGRASVDGFRIWTFDGMLRATIPCPECGGNRACEYVGNLTDFGRLLDRIEQDPGCSACFPREEKADFPAPPPTAAEELLAALNRYIEERVEDTRAALDFTSEAGERESAQRRRVERELESENRRLRDDLAEVECDLRELNRRQGMRGGC